MAENKHEYLTLEEVRAKIKENEAAMRRAAKAKEFEDAAHFRDEMRRYQQMEVDLS